MGSKYPPPSYELSEDEQASLIKLCGSKCETRIPDAHAQRLLDLGLVEVSCGSIRPTRTGRHIYHSRPH